MNSCEHLKAGNDANIRINRKAKNHLNLLTKQIKFTEDYVSWPEVEEDTTNDDTTHEKAEETGDEIAVEDHVPTTDPVESSTNEPANGFDMEMNDPVKSSETPLDSSEVANPMDDVPALSIENRASPMDNDSLDGEVS